jgi:hypothetical protein
MAAGLASQHSSRSLFMIHCTPLLNKWDQDGAYFDEFVRSKEEESMIWVAIQDIRAKSQKCGEQEKSESSWSHEVIRPLIEHALKYTPWQDRVQVEVV